MEELNLEQIHSADRQDVSADILFIHGLGGDYKSSWCAEGDDTFWPQWMAEDLPSFGVYSLHYHSPKVFLATTDVANMPLYDKAKEILDFLSSSGIGKNPLIIISYSLGGLLTKQILRICNDNNNKKWTKLLNNTIGVVFLGTPHDGSSMANIATIVQDLPIVNLVCEKSDVVETLKKNNAALRDLKEWYAKNVDGLGIVTKAYYEMKKNEYGVLVVDQSSANPGVLNGDVVPVDADHTTISKPASKASPLHKSVSSFVQDCLVHIELDDQEKEKIQFLDEEIDRYKTQLDRLSLDEKLIKGQRDYEIKDALRKKLSFDKRLKRHSAQKSATSFYNNILGEVESRFHRYIYQLISTQATNQEINDAIYSKVIDPIVANYKGSSTPIDATLIDEMIFYLTGLCNIRWHDERN